MIYIANRRVIRSEDIVDQAIVKTRQQWAESHQNLGQFLNVGDPVDNDFVEWARDIMPPAHWTSRIIQIGRSAQPYRGTRNIHNVLSAQWLPMDFWRLLLAYRDQTASHCVTHSRAGALSGPGSHHDSASICNGVHPHQGCTPDDAQTQRRRLLVDDNPQSLHARLAWVSRLTEALRDPV